MLVRLNKLIYTMSNQQLNRDSSKEQSRGSSDAVFQFLSEALFDKISFISFPFTQTQQIYPRGNDGIAVSYPAGSPYEAAGITKTSDNFLLYIEGDVTDTERYWGVSRIPNTSEGKFLSAGRSSRVRCSFYTKNSRQLDGYILSPVVFDSFSSLNFFTSMDIFRAYVGIKFYAGDAYVAVKEAGKAEKLTPIEINPDVTTYRLDMITGGKSTAIYIDNINIGVFPTDFTTGFENINKTFLPLLSPAKSLDGTEVGITIENFQFIQDN